MTRTASKLRAEGNALCSQCHMPAKFDAAEHHHHAARQRRRAVRQLPHADEDLHGRGSPARSQHSGSAAGSVGVDRHAERMHQCHADRSAIGPRRAIADWYPHGRQTQPHYATALHAGRTGAADAEQRLDALILDRSQPAIARASALPLLARYATPGFRSGDQGGDRRSERAGSHPQRRARCRPSPSRAVVQAVAPLLSDPVRAVRIETARALAGVDPQAMTPEQRTAFDSAYRELVAAEMVDADRPEAHLNLGLLDLRRQQPAEAEAEYRTALRLDPSFVPAMVNLADLDRMRGHGPAGCRAAAQGDGDRTEQCRCPAFARSAAGAAAQLRRGVGRNCGRPANWLPTMRAMPMSMPSR